MLTAAEHAEIIKAHWKNLWPLPAKRRMEVLEQLILDYELEAQLHAVSEQMELVA